jgi:hypothetical protein
MPAPARSEPSLVFQRTAVTSEADLSQLSHRLSGQHRTEAHRLDNRRILTCGYGFWRTGWTGGIDLRIKRLRSRSASKAGVVNLATTVTFMTSASDDQARGDRDDEHADKLTG